MDANKFPSACHQIVPRLHEDESFIRLAQRCLSGGFLFLGLSLSLALYLQAARSFQDDHMAAIADAGVLALFALTWWAYPRWRERDRDEAATRHRTTRSRSL